MSLKGKVVLVTGGSSGIGRATAALLKAHAAEVVIAARNKERLFRIAFELGVHAKVCDITVKEEVKELTQYIHSKFGKIDFLINNAGIASSDTTIENIDLVNSEDVFKTNVLGPISVVQEFIPMFKNQKSGTIVNVGNLNSYKNSVAGAVYASSKAALKVLTEYWREELSEYKIRVCLVNPSETTTAFGQANGVERFERHDLLRPYDVAAVIKSLLELDERAYIGEMDVLPVNH